MAKASDFILIGLLGLGGYLAYKYISGTPGRIAGGVGDFFGDLFGGIGDFFGGLFGGSPSYDYSKEREQEAIHQEKMSEKYGSPINYVYETTPSQVSVPHIQKSTALVKSKGITKAVEIMAPTVKQELVQQSGGTKLNELIVGKFGK